MGAAALLATLCAGLWLLRRRVRARVKGAPVTVRTLPLQKKKFERTNPMHTARK